MRRLTPLVLCLYAACTNGGAVHDDDQADPGGETAAPAGKSVYVIATAVSDDSASNTYVAATDSLEVEKLDLSKAREFGGWSDIGVIGKWVLVSSGESPEIKRFTVDEKLELQSAGEISFAKYTDDANFYNQELVSPTKAYLSGQGEFVIWNPSKLEIVGTLPFPQGVEKREGIEPYIALDRGAVVRGDRLYVTLAWTDTEELKMLAASKIVVIDVKADQIVEVLDVPCPDIMVADSDDEGNLYFSNWVYSPGATLLFDYSPACVARIRAGHDELDDWQFGYAQETDHEGAVVNYLGEGRWLYSSFLGDPADYDPKTDDWFDWLFGDTWRLEVLDPKTRKSHAVTGIPRNGGGYYSARFDDVTHLLIPEEGYTATTIYAVDASGKATRELHTNGWSTRLFKLR